MPSPIPPVIESYFRAKNAHDIAAIAACFHPEAVVQDEGKELRGLDAIRGWVEETTRKYAVTAEITDTREQGGKTIVTALVSGNFDGSPISLDFHFGLREGKISALSVEVP